MKTLKNGLLETTEKVSKAFEDIDLTVLNDILLEYNKNVEKHYNEYVETNNIWEKIKYKIGKKEEYAKND